MSGRVDDRDVLNGDPAALLPLPSPIAGGIANGDDPDEDEDEEDEDVGAYQDEEDEFEEEDRDVIGNSSSSCYLPMPVINWGETIRDSGRNRGDATYYGRTRARGGPPSFDEQHGEAPPRKTGQEIFGRSMSEKELIEENKRRLGMTGENDRLALPLPSLLDDIASLSTRYRSGWLKEGEL